MGTKMQPIRFRKELLAEMDELCAQNNMGRSEFLTFAVLNLIRQTAKQGLVSPLQERTLPPHAVSAARKWILKNQDPWNGCGAETV